MKGIVLKSTGSWYQVKEEISGKIIECRVQGKIRLKGVKTTNPVSVGDIVNFIIESNSDEKTGSIQSIEPRKNYIIRKSINLSKQYQIIASNIDQLALVITLVAPTTTTTFIDRYLASAEAYSIPTLLVFNKIDMYEQKELDHINDLKDIYEKIGYQVLYTSTTKNIGLEKFKKLLTNKTTLISGHSGVGKSSLANSLDNNLDLKTGSISINHLSGKHTTTFAEMHPLNFGGYLIDTPGIKSFAPPDLDKDKIHHYFPEIFKFSEECKFNNCIHIKEPKCRVKKALEEGDIAVHRYQSYLSMYNEDEEIRYRKDDYA